MNEPDIRSVVSELEGMLRRGVDHIDCDASDIRILLAALALGEAKDGDKVFCAMLTTGVCEKDAEIERLKAKLALVETGKPVAWTTETQLAAMHVDTDKPRLIWGKPSPLDTSVPLYAAPPPPAPAETGEPVDWPKIMYVCESCREHYPEECGRERADIYVTGDGKWICDDCRHEYDYGPVTPAPLLYASPSPPAQAGAMERYYERQIEWSRETFGPALRTGGLMDHIRKELREIEQNPHDLSEWVDVIILAMDGFWRHGGKASDLMPALLAKQRKNMARAWPDWRTMSEDAAIEHNRGKADERA